MGIWNGKYGMGNIQGNMEWGYVWTIYVGYGMGIWNGDMEWGYGMGIWDGTIQVIGDIK
uniref:Uncharacterized protein n=1 Tax=viral metagenome TaxID=1070528 RepID=A0A6C0EL10_9ZZZZ